MTTTESIFAPFAHLSAASVHRCVSLLARGTSPSKVVDATTLPPRVVASIAAHYGPLPHLDKLCDAADLMAREIAAAPSGAPARPDGTLQVIGQARRLGGRLAARGDDLLRRLDQLRVDVAAAVEKAEAERKANEERQAKLAELVKLEAAVKKLRAELGSGATGAVRTDCTLAEERAAKAWARSHGREPGRGRASAALVAEWRKATAA